MRSILILLWSAAALFSADFLPLQFGNNWTYRNAASGQTFTIRVSTPIMTNGRVYHSLMGYTAAGTTLVRRNEQGNLVYLNQETGQEQLLTSFEPFESGWWEAPGRVCDTQGQTQLARSTFDGAIGPIQDVLEIRYRNLSCADAGIASENYAANIGMVRRTLTTFIGPVQFDLVSARVGSLRVEAAPSGRFTVSVAGAEGWGAFTATLRIDIQGQHPLTLDFSSGQEYDLELRNAAGQSVWRWSADKAFIAIPHQRTIDGEFTVKVDIPRPASGVAGPYTLHAWMTTASEAPRFAATVPLTIAPQ